MKKLFLAALVAALSGWATPASADTLTFQGYSALTKGAWVSLTLGAQTITGWAGELEWTLNGSSNFSSYCVDLFDDALIPNQSGTLKVTGALSSTTSDLASQPDAGAKAAWLGNTFGGGIAGFSAADAAAGLQLAIWQALYGVATPGGTWSYSASTAIQNATNTAHNALMAQYNNAATRSLVTSSSAVYFDVFNTFDANHHPTSSNGQDQMQVPEPATILLMAIAMFSLLGYQSLLKRRDAGI